MTRFEVLGVDLIEELPELGDLILLGLVADQHAGLVENVGDGEQRGIDANGDGHCIGRA